MLEQRDRPQPVRRVFIPKLMGGCDRWASQDGVVQAAVHIVIEPLFEASFLSEETYAEEPVVDPVPEFRPDQIGIHHFHSNGRLAAFDILRLSRIR